MRVDFHVHSTASDGTCVPSELAARASKQGISVFALTDHDNCDGAADLLRAGAEIEQSNNLNNPNNRTIFSYAHGEVLARPHFARWLMERGYVRSIAEAFERYLLPESPMETRCYEERWHPSQEDAFAAVHGAGGLCVMAHPKYWRSNWKSSGCDFAAAERELAALKEKGLDGVEALYQANTGEENVEFTRIATKLGYLKSAGSDFHGANKPHIPLGMDVSVSFIAPLLEALDREDGVRCLRGCQK